MGGFFRGWKRKLGVVTLVIALVLMAGWIRSFVASDDVHLHCGPRHNCIASDLGCVRWLTFDSDSSWGLNWQFVSGEKERTINRIEQNLMASEGATSGQKVELPYVAFAVPITLLSCFLLLSKPLKSNQMKIFLCDFDNLKQTNDEYVDAKTLRN